MARLHEHQGKAVLSAAGIKVPRGRVARSAAEAVAAARQIGLPVMVKVQAWTTGRAAAGGIARAGSAEEAGEHASRMLALRFGRFPVDELLIEETIPIRREFFLSLAIDERQRAPVLLLSASGGSGVESRADQTRRIPCHVRQGPDAAALTDAMNAIGVPPDAQPEVERVARKAFQIARDCDARSLEINPLALTDTGAIIAADCRITIDDYAVARRPELGIEIARELDHPPTPLERLAYRIEQEDHRGTFFFAQMNDAAPQGSKGLIGFHGAGGGGSMMSMDAISAAGFTPANFCDTSGNPSPAKVYRAARIILAQPGLAGYFGSGSGVANQEQFWSAYGLAKAFWELELSIPAVVRLGGNAEDRAVEILQSACAELPARVEAYRKNDPPARIAARFAELVAEHQQRAGERALWSPRTPRVPAFVEAPGTPCFELKGGRLFIDPKVWAHAAPAIIARSNGTLRDERGVPAPALASAEFQGKDSDLIACEVECRRDGIGGVFVRLDLPATGAGEHGKAGA
jgi:succinyl-CoA synthetase beta subunit